MKAAVLDEDVVLAASSPAGFAWVASADDSEPYVPEQFHLKVAEGLVDVEQGRLELLVIELPVQHGKSTLASQWGSAWLMGLHPNWKNIAATHTSSFAEDQIGGPTRDIIERHGRRFFGVSVNPFARAMRRWKTTEGGMMLSLGVEKSVIGRRGDHILVDDPYPSRKEALNPRFRKGVWEWFVGNILSRRPKPLRMVAIMSRWASDDFIGQLVSHATEKGWNFRVLHFPAIAICPVEGCGQYLPIERDGKYLPPCDHGVRDELGRLPGEALWPKVRPIDFLLRQREDMGSYLFDAQFQCTPHKQGGTFFRQQWFRYFRREGEAIVLLDNNGAVIARYPITMCRIFQIVDLASGDTQTLRSGITRAKAKPDYTVIGSFALCPRNELAVLDIFRDNKIQGPDQVPLMGSMRSKWNAGRIGIEAVQYQWTAVQGAVAVGLPAVPIIRGGESKETRAWTIGARYEAGQVFHLQGAPWLGDLESELIAFPNGDNDDQVDVLSDAGAVVDEARNHGNPQGVRVG